MTADDETLERLDRIITLLEIGFAQQIERARTELRSAPVAAAVLDLAGEVWLPAGDIQRAVTKSAKVSDRTVERSIAGLVGRGALRVRGSGRAVSYRSAGIL